jgi:hypothetical protein
MIRVPFRHAWGNVIFQGAVETFGRDAVRWSHGLNYLIILAVVLFITWPKEAFLALRDLPFTYNALGGATLILLSYVSFSQGSRKSVGEERMPLRDWLMLAPVSADTFTRGYLAFGLLECVFYWGLILPLLVMAAGASGESLSHTAAGAGIILVCTASYRILATALLFCLERDEFILYLVVRLLYVFWILVSGFGVPLCNPVLAFVDASLWHHRHPLPSWGLLDVDVPGWLLTIGVHLLLGGLFFIIATIRVRWIRRRAEHLGLAMQEENHGGLSPS